MGLTRRSGWTTTGISKPLNEGDGNADKVREGDPFWLPLGAPQSNPFPGPRAGTAGDNFTPNFPAYPSGHASFGTACFRTFAGLIGMDLDKIKVKFASDEFNGITTDNEGITRPKWTQDFNLQVALEQNSVSRIYLGVHWKFDADGGEDVGEKVAAKAVAAFKICRSS